MRYFLPVIFFLLAVLGTSFVATAEDPVRVNVNLPGTYSVKETGPVGIIGNFYQFAFLIAGMLAFGAIVWGAIKRTLSAGNPGMISDANEWITSALLGLLLLLGAYIILNTVNPALTKIALPGLETPEGTPTGQGTSTPSGSGLAPDGLFSFQPGIRAQYADASPALKGLLTCMAAKVPGNAGEISSISDSRIVQGEETFQSCAQNGCAHSAGSCHYGGTGKCNGSSYAVDFGDEQNQQYFTQAANECTGGKAFVNFEGNHVHISVGAMNGCGCN